MTQHGPQPIRITVLGDKTRTISVTPEPSGAISVPLDGPPGLYQLSVVLDGAEYDWERMYEPLHKFHNTGQLTGPWDFSINHDSVPVVPAYRVALDRRPLGMWFFSRISLEDLERKVFRGRMALHVRGPGELTLTPYREMRVRWLSALLEPDPEDTLEPLPEGILPARGHAPMARWTAPGFWEGRRAALEGTHALYREPVARAIEWAMTEGTDARGVLPLVAAWRLEGREEALQRALELVDRIVVMPAFGNPNPDGYSHNGDMGAMKELMGLAWAWHLLGDELGEERRARLAEKIVLQGETFLELALLNRDYWGGSVLQDHGWKSMFGFGAFALHMLGELPEAERWVSYILPRLRRSLAAMPRDGVIPPTSHYGLFTYTDEVTHYRDALLALTGEDIFEGPQFAEIIEFAMAAYHPPTGKLISAGRDALPVHGGHYFLGRMAGKLGDGRAAWLQQQLLSRPPGDFTHGNHPYALHLGAMLGLLSYDPVVPARDPGPMPPRLRHFPDQDVVHYRNDDTGVVLAARVGPYSSHTGHRLATGPCDRLGDAPGMGHFTLCVEGVPLLCSPDGGYRLRSFLRSCLLVDDQGQFGDIGYPMSIAGWKHRGEQIEVARWDESTGRGLVRMDLQPAYAEEAGLVQYTREFQVGPEREIILRDLVVCDRPRLLSWLFQTKQQFGVELEGTKATIGEEPRLTIAPIGEEPALSAGVHETQVVWSYSSTNHFRPFVHVRYDTTEAVEAVMAQFALRWRDGRGV